MVSRIRLLKKSDSSISASIEVFQQFLAVQSRKWAAARHGTQLLFSESIVLGEPLIRAAR
jgi:hypothetical protein